MDEILLIVIAEILTGIIVICAWIIFIGIKKIVMQLLDWLRYRKYKREYINNFLNDHKEELVKLLMQHTTEEYFTAVQNLSKVAAECGYSTKDIENFDIKGNVQQEWKNHIIERFMQIM